MSYQNFFKPIVDFSLAILVFFLFSPLFILICVALIFFNNGVPFFMQMRVGQYGETFRILKFKTMNDKQDKAGNLLPDSLRITSFGRFLRKTSLDELPQILNIISGKLSLVGPRPLLVAYLSHYTKEQFQRHNVKPGITGLAQVNGRQSISFERRFEYDVWYVNNLSFRLDVMILYKTFLNLFKSKGIIEDERPWIGNLS